LKSAFRKIAWVRTFTGATTWYLSDDCLLAAKRTAYSVEYRRFYLRDLESVVVWPSRSWLFQLGFVAVLFTALGVLFWQWVNLTAGEIIGGVGFLWIALELVRGPSAKSRICTIGSKVDLPLVSRTRRAKKVLGKIDAAVRSGRALIEQSASPSIAPPSPENPVETNSGASETDSISATAQTNAS